MARVTVEDCLKNVENRFDLVLKGAERARKLELGAADATVPLDNDKPTVIALREIAAGNDITNERVEVEVEDASLVEEEVVEIDLAQNSTEFSLEDELKSEFAEHFKDFADFGLADDSDDSTESKAEVETDIEIESAQDTQASEPAEQQDDEENTDSDKE